MSTLQVRFAQIPGHKEYSPRGKYIGLRKRTAEERLEEIKIVISVGTTFEALNIQEILSSREDVMVDNLVDVRRIVTGHSGNLPIALLEPTTRGQFPQYAAMRLTLNLCPNADHFYKTGGMAGPMDMGDIIVAEEDGDGVLVDDVFMDKQWKTHPGFPGADLRQAAFQAAQPTRRETLSTGPDLIRRLTSSKPYEIELSGWLTALDRHGAFAEKNHIGVIGVISENFDMRLKKMEQPECFQKLISFWRFFLEKLQ